MKNTASATATSLNVNASARPDAPEIPETTPETNKRVNRMRKISSKSSVQENIPNCFVPQNQPLIMI